MTAPIKSYAKAIFETTEGQSKAKINSLVDGLLQELAVKNLLPKLPQLIKELDNLSDIKAKIIRVEIKTARQLTKQSATEIVSFIRQRTGAEEVIFTETIDDSIGGGFIVYFGDTIIDASLAGAVNELANQIGR